MLVLDEPEETFRESFHDGRSVVSEPLVARWRRSADAGVRDDSAAYAEGIDQHELRGRRDRLADVFREESALLSPIASDFASRSLVAIVADPEGVILSAHGGGDFVLTAARSRLVEGASWAESTRGTNAIGTALAEERPVAVVGSAHYEMRNAALFCYASPVRDAYGEIACVLDVTGSMDHHDRSVGVAVKAAAAGLERALRMRAFATSGMGGLPVLERLVRRCSTPAFLVEAGGDVHIMNDAAKAALHNEGAALDSTKIFGLSYRQLVDLAVRGNPGRFETSRASFRVELDTVAGSRGTLAVLVYLEPVTTTTTTRAPTPTPPPPPSVPRPAFARILGSDPGLERAKMLTERFAATDLPVLLLAETGTGKELFARALHDASKRRANPFIALNCGALSATLLESELFGHSAGAFTGAAKNGAEGKIAAAHGGTLFLDEIAEMPEPLQAALLRVLDDDGVYYRVGEAHSRRADFRLVCATCRDLPRLVEEGRFRRDLFFRIHGASLTIPPVRSRNDRVELARGLLAMIAPKLTLADDAVEWIQQHHWQGNVRELKSALSHAVALADGDQIHRADFPEILLPSSATTPPPSDVTRDAILKTAVDDALRACDGNVSEAARRLGVARTTVYRMMRKK